MKRPRILMVPMARGDRRVCIDLVMVGVVAGARGYDCLPAVGHYPISHARNRAVEAMLAGPYDAIFFIDEDTYPISTIDALVQCETIISECGLSHAAYVFRTDGKDPWVWTTGKWVDNNVAWPSADQAPPMQFPDVCATGFTMIRRDVLEHPDVAADIKRKCWFNEVFDGEYGSLREGDDVMFTRRATQAGFRIGVAVETCLHAKVKQHEGNFKPSPWMEKPGHIREGDLP